MEVLGLFGQDERDLDIWKHIMLCMKCIRALGVIRKSLIGLLRTCSQVSLGYHSAMREEYYLAVHLGHVELVQPPLLEDLGALRA